MILISSLALIICYWTTGNICSVGRKGRGTSTLRTFISFTFLSYLFSFSSHFLLLYQMTFSHFFFFFRFFSSIFIPFLFCLFSSFASLFSFIFSLLFRKFLFIIILTLTITIIIYILSTCYPLYSAFFHGYQMG